MSKADAAIRAIEAAYASTPSQGEWFRAICDELNHLGLGPWGGYVVEDAAFVPESVIPIEEAGYHPQSASDAWRVVPPTFVAAAHIPAPRLESARGRWDRLARTQGTTVFELEQQFNMSLPRVNGLLCFDSTGTEGVLAVLPETAKLSRRLRHQLVGVAAHIEHAHRLRRRLGQWKAEDAAAVLSTEGKLLHGAPGGEEDRSSLAFAVKESESSRGRLRRLDSSEAVDRWSALVDGRWSIVDHVERDGKRFILAFENLPDGGPLKLAERERQVITYAALGHANKYIAYELGISPASVTGALKSGLRKLGLNSRSELIQVFGPFVRPPGPP